MDTLILEDFRCFAERHEVPIRPLTLLVGENSTGKTSFLAAVRAAYDLRLSPTDVRRFLEGSIAPDFNEEPFHLGSYDQIANYRAGPLGRAKSFIIGQQITAEHSLPMRTRTRTQRGRHNNAVRIKARFAVSRSQPILSEFRASTSDHEIVITENSRSSLLSFRIDDHVAFERRTEEKDKNNIFINVFDMEKMAEEDDSISLTSKNRRIFKLIARIVLSEEGPRPYAFAPIRTRPQRTYDPIKEIREPEGSHVPMLLARTFGNMGAPDFKKILEGFGVDSGLYSDIRIRRVGRKESDPFQIEVKPTQGGTWRNLVDVGYGVSQAIPIIADAASTEPGTTLLIQQPEVHLHPRAQAAMGSFYAQLADSGRNRLVVETHSDHLVDRVRMDVRDERIKASDVVILYFDQGERGVDIHPIEVDTRGHPVEVPPGYRSFFLDEDRRFFGVDR